MGCSSIVEMLINVRKIKVLGYETKLWESVFHLHSSSSVMVGVANDLHFTSTSTERSGRKICCPEVLTLDLALDSWEWVIIS
jgi:hypothetical protein